MPGDVSLTVKNLDVVRTRGYASLYADATATTGTCRFLGIFVRVVHIIFIEALLSNP